MPRTKQQYESMRAATEQKLYTAGMRLFIDKGFAATAVQEIAALAGVSVGLLYRHFESKEALFDHIVETATNGLIEATRRMEAEGDPQQSMRAMAEEIYTDLSSGDELSDLMALMSQAFLAKDALPGMKALVDADINLMRAAAMVIRRGQDEGVFSPGDADQMATLFFAGIQGLSLMKQSMGDAFIMPSVDLMLGFLYRTTSHDGK